MNYKAYIIALATLACSWSMAKGQASEGSSVPDSVSTQQVDKVKLPFAELNKERVVGATSVITQDQLATTDLNVTTAMIGKAAGVNVYKNSAAPGGDNSWINVRGRHTTENDGPLVVIDGVSNRLLQSLNYYEIESITVLKDATAKILYGPQAANGVILVTTKRGKAGEKKASFNAEYGVRRPTHLPDFVNSADYARLYNKALENDGRETLYSDDIIAKYELNGINDTLPNVDFHDRYLKEQTTFKRIFGTYTNSNENTNFFFSAGYQGEGGLEAIGEESRYNGMNVRSNLDYKINDVFSVQLDVAARLELLKSNQMSYENYEFGNKDNPTKVDGFFTLLSKHRPNEYPIYLNPDKGLLGWGPGVNKSIEGELTKAGYRQQELRQSQVNAGFNWDFTKWGVEGLSWKNYVSFDTYSSLFVKRINEYAQYRNDSSKVNDDKPASDLSNEKNTDDIYRNSGWISTVTYDRQFGDHSVLVNLNSIAQNRTFRGLDQPNKNLTIGFRGNYMYDSRFVGEIDLAYMGSNKLEEGNRFQMFPAVGAGWILSNESFLQSIDQINYLKVKASWGQMGYDRNLDHFLYQNAYGEDGWVQFGLQSSLEGANAYSITKTGNPSIGYEIATEYNVGFEALLIDGLSVEANYFNEHRTDIPLQVEAAFPDYFGEKIPVSNFGEVSNQGYELSLNYAGNYSDVNYSVGGFITYSKAIYEKAGDNQAEDYLNKDGQPLDRIMGLTSTGFYTDAPTDEDPKSQLGGTVMAGDLMYVDTNEDGFITKEDQTVIGNSTPRYIYGLNFNVGYKGINLYVLGQGAAGHERMLVWNTAYTGKGNEKYAANALNYWTADNQDATHPRLTVDGKHSYEGSTFWLEDASYFTIRNIELSYSMPQKVLESLGGASQLKVFVRGTDLLTFSKSDFNADNLKSGIESGPLMKTVSLGVNLTY